MDSRKKMAAKPPGSDDVYYLLLDAQSGSAEAFNALRSIAREELANDRPPPVDLRNYFAGVGLSIFTADDPVKELRSRLGLPRGRGPAKDKERAELDIMSKVQRLRDREMSLEKACEAVAKQKGVRQGAERVRKIYLSRRNELMLRKTAASASFGSK